MRWLAALITLLGAIVFGFSGALAPELTPLGRQAAAALILVIGWWIFQPGGIPFSISAVAFLALLLTFGVPAGVVFSGYSSGAIWTLIPTLFLGYALGKTGLGRRIACFCLKSLRPTWGNLLLMCAGIGIVLSLLTSSITVRVVVVTPIALNAVHLLGLPKKSPERSMFLITAWMMATIPGMGWMSGSLNGPVLSGLYAAVPDLSAPTFSLWLRASLLPVALTTAATSWAGYLLFRPAHPLPARQEVFASAYLELGPISWHEQVTLATLTASFLLLATGGLHQVPNAAICLGAMFILVTLGVIKTPEISSGISWDLILFVGATMSLEEILKYTGLTEFLAGLIIPAIAPVAEQPLLFLPLTFLLFIAWRFVDIAVFVPTMAVVASVLPEIQLVYGIHPAVFIPILCLAANAFILSYTNIFVLVAEKSLGEEGWRPRHLAAYGLIYAVVGAAAIAVSVPFWHLQGLL
jgi:di/tricarboxylate transporter